MKAEIDRDGCISCGLCVSVCPGVFQMGDDGLAEVYVETIPSDMEKDAIEAQDSCPVNIITVE